MTAVAQGLTGVSWAGLDLMGLGGGLDKIVTDVEGWYSTPDVTTNDVVSVLADGGVFGPKFTKPREIVVTGTVLGARDKVMQFRDQLAARMLSAVPSELTITDPWLGTSLTAMVRGEGPMAQSAIGSQGFSFQLPLIAADARLYETDWSTGSVLTADSGSSGRIYPRAYTWAYGGAQAAGTVTLDNPGNVPAPVQALYTGPLSESRLTDGTDTIHLAAIADGVQLLVPTDTLLVQAQGGVSRADYVRAGSTPLLLDPESTTTWALLATGLGTVDLYWRGAYA